MSKNTDFLLKALHIISWFIFVGVSIDAGGVLSNTVYTIFIDSDLAAHFWGYLDLSKLFQFNQSLFITLTTIMSIVTLLKAVLFYIILKVFYTNKLDITNPFKSSIGKYIYIIAYCALVIGLFSKWGENLLRSVVSQNLTMPLIQDLKIGGGDVWLFMSVILLIFAMIFKKGIELQNENDLTV